LNGDFTERMPHATGPQLITYADRLAGDLTGLRTLLDGPLAGAFTGVHVLPFYVPIDGADAGFDPTDHLAVDPRLGSWDDLAKISATHDVMADMIVNHVSDKSEQFVDWCAKGEASEYDGMFLTLGTVFADGATEHDLTTVYRPRPGLSFTRLRTADGRMRLLWTTFTSHQVDIDVEHPTGWQYLLAVVDRLATAGVSLVRLDAVGYAIKRAGTSCFMIPETFEFVDRLAAELRDRGMQVLVEVHGHHLMQIDIARRVDLVYDFALPPLVLDALYRGDSVPLRRWLEIRPANAVNVLDTHDGIGVIDVGADPTHTERPGLLEPERLSDLVEEIHRRSGGESRLATGAAASNLDIYQVNCTYYDALGRDDRRYLLARLIQCLVPGIPQVYYVGLLAGGNDLDLLAETGVGRDINRHRYSPGELAEALERPVVRSLLRLLRWRATAPVFAGSFEVLDSADHELRVRWSHGPSTTLEARIDLATAEWAMVETGPDGSRTVHDIEHL
jgi:sucrose phosphorylase